MAAPRPRWLAAPAEGLNEADLVARYGEDRVLVGMKVQGDEVRLTFSLVFNGDKVSIAEIETFVARTVTSMLARIE